MASLRNSFAGRLVAALFLLVLLPTAALGFFLYDQARNAAMQSEIASVEDASSELAARIDAFILGQRDLARFAATSTEVRSYIAGPRDAQAGRDLLASLEDGPFTSDAVADVFVLDAQGTCLVSTNPDFVGEYYGMRPYFQEAVTGNEAISDWTIGMTSDTPGIYLASPVRGEYDEMAGVLVIKLETDPVEELVDQAAAIGTKAVVFNPAGIVLTAYDPAFRYRALDQLTSTEEYLVTSTRQFADEPLTPLGLTSLKEDLVGVDPGETAVSREYELQGEARVAALTGQVTQPWVVAVIAPLSSIEEAAAPVPLIIGVVGLLVLLYAIVATLYVSRFVTRPMRDLVRSSDELAAGDLTVQVPVRGDDEVAHLAKAFNSMATEIRGNTARLEDQVVRRTAELEEANRAITHLSITDSLTGCHNRRYLDQELPREIERAGRYGRRLAVIMCDIDHFKSVNDQFGHAVGDAVLHAFGRHLDSTRRNPDWVARFGGEEFVIVLPETDLDDALTIADRFRVSTAELRVDGGREPITITASFGVAAFHPGDEDVARTLIGRSDEAMYRAKAAGRNQVQAERSG